MSLEKIDRRIHYILVLDTETANTIQVGDKLDMSNVIVYDCGWQVIDKRGNVYSKASYINTDIFWNEPHLMETAYYAEKIPRYYKDARKGLRKWATTAQIHYAMYQEIERFKIDTICAHNMRFDYNALNNTQRYVTKSAFRFWFPYGMKIWDTMRMAQSVIGKMPSYLRFCEKYNYLTKRGKPKMTAEVLWRFISHNNDFEESHTGLEDVEIESQILAYCFRQHKKMQKECFPIKETVESTLFQIELQRNIKNCQVLFGHLEGR